jgi:hypothetical protein
MAIGRSITASSSGCSAIGIAARLRSSRCGSAGVSARACSRVRHTSRMPLMSLARSTSRSVSSIDALDPPDTTVPNFRRPVEAHLTPPSHRRKFLPIVRAHVDSHPISLVHVCLGNHDELIAYRTLDPQRILGDGLAIAVIPTEERERIDEGAAGTGHLF